MPNKEQEQSIADVKSFIKVIESVDVQVNYKDKIFLEQTKKYKGYVNEQLKAISFSDIKMDLGNIKLISSLEDEYKKSKKGNAISCNDLMEDCVKDAKVRIAEAFVGFMDEIIKVRKNVKKLSTDIYLKKTNNKTMCLVYKDGVYDASKSKQDYQFTKLDDLLQTIADVTVEYCKNMKGKKAPTVPMYIRQSIVLVCYALIDFGDYISKSILKEAINENSGVQKQIIDNLSFRCDELGYPYFKNSDHLYQYDKWSISPEEAFHVDSYIPPLSPIVYLGIKEGYLGYMLAELQKQVPHKVFLDAFGGSGISIVQFKHMKDIQYYVNDYDFAIVCYYQVLKADKKDFNEFITKLEFLRDRYSMAYDRYKENTISKDEFYKFSDSLFGVYEMATAVCCDFVRINKLFNIDLSQYDPFIEGLNSAFGESYSLPVEVENLYHKKINYTDIAALFVAFSNMPVSGAIEKRLISSTGKFCKKTEKILREEFNSIRQAYADVNIVSIRGESAMELLEDGYNSEEILAYLDSPYVGTSGYNVNKESDDSERSDSLVISVNDYGKRFIADDNGFDISDLIQKCHNYKGKFIFSCRANMADANTKAVIQQINKLSTKVQVSFNNHLWFMKQWMRSNYYVLFMCRKDIDTANFHDVLIVEDARRQGREPEWYMGKESVEDTERRERIVKSNWGITLEESTKDYIYRYIKYKVLSAYPSGELEIMITNFDFDTTRFIEYSENIANLYGKQTEAMKKSKLDNIYCKMPMSLFAEIVIGELSNCSNYVGDLVIK